MTKHNNNARSPQPEVTAATLAIHDRILADRNLFFSTLLQLLMPYAATSCLSLWFSTAANMKRRSSYIKPVIVERFLTEFQSQLSQFETDKTNSSEIVRLLKPLIQEYDPEFSGAKQAIATSQEELDFRAGKFDPFSLFIARQGLFATNENTQALAVWLKALDYWDSNVKEDQERTKFLMTYLLNYGPSKLNETGYTDVYKNGINRLEEFLGWISFGHLKPEFFPTYNQNATAGQILETMEKTLKTLSPNHNTTSTEGATFRPFDSVLYAKSVNELLVKPLLKMVNPTTTNETRESLYYGYRSMLSAFDFEKLLPYVLWLMDLAIYALYGISTLLFSVAFAIVIPRISRFLVQHWSPIPESTASKLQKLGGLNSVEAGYLLDEMRKIEQKSTPLGRYSSYGLFILLLCAIYAFVSDLTRRNFAEETSMSIAFLVVTALTLLSNLTKHAHRYFERGVWHDRHITLVSERLKTVLLLQPGQRNHQFLGLEATGTITRREAWDRLQFALKPSSRDTKLPLKYIAAISSVLDKFGISHQFFKGEIYIEVASAYEVLCPTLLGRESANVAKMAQRIQQQFIRLDLIKQLMENVFLVLRNHGVISKFWLDDDEKNKICYDLVLDKHKSTELKEKSPFLFALIQPNGRFVCDINEKDVKRIMGELRAYQEIPTSYPVLSEHGGNKPKTKPVFSTPVKHDTQLPGNSSIVSNRIYTWMVPGWGKITYPEDQRVKMVFGTKDLKNPCFVVNALKEDDFNGSGRTYAAACAQLEYPRFAAAKAQQGLVQDGEDIKLKILGKSGDARFYPVKLRDLEDKATLLFFNKVVLHSH